MYASTRIASFIFSSSCTSGGANCQALGANWGPTGDQVRPPSTTTVDQRSRANHTMLIKQQLSKKISLLGRGTFDIQRAATAMKVAALGPTFLWQVGKPSCHKCVAHRFFHHDRSAPTRLEARRRGQPTTFQKSRFIFQDC